MLQWNDTQERYTMSGTVELDTDYKGRVFLAIRDRVMDVTGDDSAKSPEAFTVPPAVEEAYEAITRSPASERERMRALLALFDRTHGEASEAVTHALRGATIGRRRSDRAFGTPPSPLPRHVQDERRNPAQRSA